MWLGKVLMFCFAKPGKKRAGTHSRRHDEDQACDNALCAPLLGPITPSAEVIQHFVQLQDLDITVPANHADASVCEQQHTECPDPGLLSDIEIDVDYQGNFASDSHLSGTTALHIAAEAGHLGVVKMIVQCGIDASSRDGRARTALHLASRRGHDGIVSFLLEQGVEIDAPDFMGWTALHMAAAAGAETTVSRLIQSGSNIHARTTQN